MVLDAEVKKKSGEPGEKSIGSGEPVMTAAAARGRKERVRGWRGWLRGCRRLRRRTTVISWSIAPRGTAGAPAKASQAWPAAASVAGWSPGPRP